MEQVLYQLPEGWEWLSFDSLVENLDGKRIPVKTSERSKEYAIYPYYGATGIIDYVDDYIYEGEKLLISEDGANLVARKYPIAFLADGKYWVNNHAHVVDAYKDKISNKYLSYFFSVLDLSSFITGSAQPKLSQKKLNSIKIAVAPITEQKHIVEKLDALLSRIDNAVEHLQESIALADALYASALDKKFSKLMAESEILPFKKLVDNQDGKRIPIKAGERENTHGTFPYYGATGIIDYVDDFIFEGERLLISEDGANLVARKYPIAFIASGKYWVNNHAHVVDALPGLTSNLYLKKFFAWVDLSSYITGSAQPKLSQGKLNTIPVPVPALSVQGEIVAKLDRTYQLTESLKKEVEEKLEMLIALKASILDSAFKGEL